MGPIPLAFFGLVAVVLKACLAQYLPQSCCMSSVVPTRTIITRTQEPSRCSPTSTEDLNKLIVLAKLLVENKTDDSNKDNIDSEGIIKKLIDALIYANLQYNQCRTTLKILIRAIVSASIKSGNKSLIDLRLLDPSLRNNILDLIVAGQDLLGIGLGNSGGGLSGSGGKGDEKNSSLIDIGLLRPNQKDNILDLDIVDQDFIGIGLGNTPENPSSKEVIKKLKLKN